MAKFGGDIVLYKSAAGFMVPAVVLRYVTSDGEDTDTALASASYADLCLLNAAATKLTTVPKATSGTFADKDTSNWETGRWALPA